MSIRIFVTGGTFDKEYNELTGELHFKETRVPKMLAEGRSQLPTHTTALMSKDSLDMTDADRHVIALACQSAKESQIVITHGTDTMTTTAAVLAAQSLNKTIVLTGAMVPCSFGGSDGLFNLGCAVAFVQALPAGIYIAMNGTAFPWNQVRKNRDLGVFESVSA